MLDLGVTAILILSCYYTCTQGGVHQKGKVFGPEKIQENPHSATGSNYNMRYVEKYRTQK